MQVAGQTSNAPNLIGCVLLPLWLHLIAIHMDSLCQQKNGLA